MPKAADRYLQTGSAHEFHALLSLLLFLDIDFHLPASSSPPVSLQLSNLLFILCPIVPSFAATALIFGFHDTVTLVISSLYGSAAMVTWVLLALQDCSSKCVVPSIYL